MTDFQAILQADPGADWREQREEITQAILRVLDSGWYILGSEVSGFEAEFARYTGSGFAVGVGSGTDGIVLALRALGIGPGQGVATVSHTAVATVAAIEMVGALPVLVDIDPDSYTLDPQALDEALAGASVPVAAVIPVHLYGRAADMPAICEVAAKYGATVIEDCSQAHGACFGEAMVGSFGVCGVYSLYPTKNLGAFGDAGVVTTSDAALAEKMKVLRQYGWAERYISAYPGINTRLDELHAAVLRVKLPHLDARNEKRRAVARVYDEGLSDTSLRLPQHGAGLHVYHQYVARVEARDAFQARLKAQGIATAIHYPAPVHLQPAYRGRVEHGRSGLANTENIAGEIVSLPIFPQLSLDAAARVVDAIHKILNSPY